MNKHLPHELYISADRIKHKVKSLADKISKDYTGKEVLIVPVLKGSVVFFSDLIRRLSINCGVDFVSVSSYKGTKSTGKIKFLMGLRESPKGKNILLVEDIIDSGNTLAYLKKNLLAGKASSVRVCVLLDKKTARKTVVKVNYKGFTIPDKFVVGYGLDYNEKYRGLPYIGILNNNH
jgi:hypoxanthine phosphoribosyltransferase